jgi:hypothetical protein
VAIVTLAADLAKNVSAVHGVDVAGRAVLVRCDADLSQSLQLSRLALRRN